jgi:hypothetical protein
MPLLSHLVRSAVLSDAAALAALGRSTFVQTFMEDFAIPYPPDDIAAYLNKNYTEDAIRGMLQEAGAMTWVAEKDGALLAFANAGPNTLPSVFCIMRNTRRISMILSLCDALTVISGTPMAVAATLSSGACEHAHARTFAHVAVEPTLEQVRRAFSAGAGARTTFVCSCTGMDARE